jgi:hypothetical protein
MHTPAVDDNIKHHTLDSDKMMDNERMGYACIVHGNAKDKAVAAVLRGAGRVENLSPIHMLLHHLVHPVLLIPLLFYGPLNQMFDSCTRC